MTANLEASHDIGWAVEQMRVYNKRVCRAGWNGKGMWLCYIGEQHYGFGFPDDANNPTKGIKGLPWIGMKTADNRFVPWLASQTDLLATDWSIAA